MTSRALWSTRQPRAPRCGPWGWGRACSSMCMGAETTSPLLWLLWRSVMLQAPWYIQEEEEGADSDSAAGGSGEGSSSGSDSEGRQGGAGGSGSGSGGSEEQEQAPATKKQKH